MEQRSKAGDPSVRRSGIGGSDLAALFGISKYGDVHSLWMEKRGLLHKDISQKGVIRRGNKLEPIIADEFSEEKKLDLYEPLNTFRGQQEWMMAHPDRMFKANNGTVWGLEIKTAGREVYLRNLRNGLDFGYLLQSVYYLYVTGAAGWVLRMKHPDSWDDHDFIIRKDESTKAIFDQIIERGNWFWELVKTATEPPIEAVVNIPDPVGGSLTTTDLADWDKVGQWLWEAQQLKKEADKTAELAKLAVQEIMLRENWDQVEGPVQTDIGNQRMRIYWKEGKGRKTVKGKEALALLDKLKEVAAAGDIELVLETLTAYNSGQFTKVGAPSRTFRSYWIKGRPQIEGDKA